MSLHNLFQIVTDLQERIEKHKGYFQDFESRTKHGLIDPFIRELGWDTEDPGSVELEVYYKSRTYNNDPRADYGLKSRGWRSVMMIEVKKLQSNSNSNALVKNEGRLNRKMRDCSESEIRFLAFTDGRLWHIYDTMDGRLKNPVVIFDISDWNYKYDRNYMEQSVFQMFTMWRPYLAANRIYGPGLAALARRDPKSQVLIYPCDPDDIDDLVNNGVVCSLSSRRCPKYLAVYVTAPVSNIRFLGEINTITPEHNNNATCNLSGDTSHGKQRLRIKKNTLKSLAKPIERWNNGRKVPRRPHFKTMSKFWDAIKSN